MTSRGGKKRDTRKKATARGRTAKKSRVKDLDLGELEGKRVRGGILMGRQLQRVFAKRWGGVERVRRKPLLP